MGTRPALLSQPAGAGDGLQTLLGAVSAALGLWEP